MLTRDFWRRVACIGAIAALTAACASAAAQEGLGKFSSYDYWKVKDRELILKINRPSFRPGLLCVCQWLLYRL